MSINKHQINNFQVQTLPLEALSEDKIKGGALFPKLYGNSFLLALTESGKTTVEYNILRRCCGRTGDYNQPKTKVIFFVPTIYEDDTYKHIVKWLKKNDYPYEINTSLRDENGKDILKFYIDTYAEDQRAQFEAAIESDEEEDSHVRSDMPEPIDPREITYEMIFPTVPDDTKRKKVRPPKKLAARFIFVFDDISGELKKSHTFGSFLKMSRHMKAKTLVCSQHLNDIPLEARTQLSYLLLWPGMSPEKLKEAHHNFAIPVPLTTFFRMYQDATKPDKPGEKSHNFLYCDLKRGRFRQNFSHEYDVMMGM